MTCLAGCVTSDHLVRMAPPAVLMQMCVACVFWKFRDSVHRWMMFVFTWFLLFSIFVQVSWQNPAEKPIQKEAGKPAWVSWAPLEGRLILLQRLGRVWPVAMLGDSIIWNPPNHSCFYCTEITRIFFKVLWKLLLILPSIIVVTNHFRGFCCKKMVSG